MPITQMKQKLIHEKVSGNITGVAMDVLNELKPAVDKKDMNGCSGNA
jgi:hypothetical protein